MLLGSPQREKATHNIYTRVQTLFGSNFSQYVADCPWAPSIASANATFLCKRPRGDAHFRGHVSPIFCKNSSFFSTSPAPKLDALTLFLIVT